MTPRPFDEEGHDRGLEQDGNHGLGGRRDLDGSKGLYHGPVHDIAILGMMVAILEVSKRLLDGVPNVELITFLFIMFTRAYGKKTLIAAFAFTALETVYWGPHSWVIMYLYLWPLLVLTVDWLHRREKTKESWHLVYSILSAVYGLSFGFLCSIVYLVIGGPVMMITWWIAGIPYDIIHCVSNFFICLILYRPADYALSLVKRIART